METLITVKQLTEQLAKQPEHVVLVDCRFSLADESFGNKAYEISHISGAIYAGLNKDLSGQIVPGTTGRHPLPERDEFTDRIRQWGITNDQQVVAYDDASGAFAARLWWLFRWLGHRNVAVLDGGFKAWVDAGENVTDKVQGTQPSHFTPAGHLTSVINAEELTEFEGLVTDARELARFRGEVEPIDPIAGHIPNARCLPFTNNLTPSQNFKSMVDLRQQFRDFGISELKSTVCYCGSGVTAAHNILALVHAGFPEPTLYPGSWSEWITDPGRPIATDE